MKRILIILFVLLYCSFISSAQENCGGPFAKVFGSLIDNEGGYSLAASESEKVLYVGGIKNDSLLLLKMNTKGNIEWARRFDVVEGKADHINGMFVDTDGMLGIAGTAGSLIDGGSVFALRYNPLLNTILWSYQFNSTSPSFCSGIIEMGKGGNYLMSNNPTNPNDAELIELDRNTGVINSNFSKHYDLGSSETIQDMVYDDGMLYACGRFTDGGTSAQMRNTLLKINPANGIPEWVTLGHRPQSVSARLYGVDLVIDQGNIYSISLGDPNGTSIDFTEIFVQKTDLNGDVTWLKKYDLPGANDWLDEIISSDGGFVILARNRISPSDIELFKINHAGDLLWAKKFDFSKNDNSILLGGITSQLVELDSQIYFTAIAETAGNEDMILVKTDIQGELSDTCSVSSSINIIVTDVKNAVYYSAHPEVFEYIPEVISLDIDPGNTSANLSTNVCSNSVIIETEIDTTICAGESYEGYTQSGSFTDTFISQGGCDSIRVVHLIVNECQPDPCGLTIGTLYGPVNGNTRGYTLAATPQNDGFYAAGLKDDSVFIIKVNLTGKVLWARTFDVVPGIADHVNALIVDSDGMLALAGTAGDPNVKASVFAFRYNPITNTVLWAKEFFSTPRSYNFSLIQKGGGNYILSNNHFQVNISNNDSELLELDRNTGTILPLFSKHYQLGSSEGIYDMVYSGNNVYGIGRYTDGPDPSEMRNTLVKLNPNDGSVVWAKLGHKDANSIARLYGIDLVIDQERIYSIYHGDPSGTSLTNTKLFIQKTDLDGNVEWIKQYELAGNADGGFEIIKSGNGFVVLAGVRLTNELILFKIDPDGNILWSRQFHFSDILESKTITDIGASQLIEVGNQLIFTSYMANSNNGSDFILVRTNLNGESNIPCVENQKISIPIQNVQNPVFYDVNPEVFNYNPTVTTRNPSGIPTLLEPREECIQTDSISTFISITICASDQYEGYSVQGTYVDNFINAEGCDSIRTLNLTVISGSNGVVNKNICHGGSFEGYTTSGVYVDTFQIGSGCDSTRTLHLNVINCLPIVAYNLDACESVMANGSHMDYTEFIPSYPSSLACADVTAHFLYRDPPQENKHSCTPGINNSLAMCVTTLNSCEYLPGNNASVVIEFTINPSTDSTVQFTGLEFYEKGPTTYSWINGPSGTNNYPLFYGIRILKNGTEVYQKKNIHTTPVWTLQTYDFLENDLFKVEASTNFRIELLSYCPVGNGADVSAWDLDEIKIYAGCISPIQPKPVIEGNVFTKAGPFVKDVQLSLADNQEFIQAENTLTDHSGHFLFDDLQAGGRYFLKGYKNDDVMNGVSTLDLLHIQKHLLGIDPFSSLDQYVAADINRNGNVSVMDLIELRKLILGIYTEFPENTSWRFAAMPQDLSGTDLNLFQEIKSIEYLEKDTQRVNFTGIKIGDLNGDVHLVTDNIVKIRHPKQVSFTIDDNPVKDGIPYTIDVRADQQIDVDGFQLSVNLKGIEVISLEGKKIPVTDENFSFIDGKLRISWSQAQSLSIGPDDVLFTITLISQQSGLLSDKIKLADEILTPELYVGHEEEAYSLILKMNGLPDPNAEIGLFEAEPNPFSSSVDIRFYLINGGKTILRFYDVSGRLLYETENIYSPGGHTEKIKGENIINNEGVVYCQIICNNYTRTQKLIKLR
ncbi:MAG: hypothetical protein ABJB16_09870 [Saprospiraceae bacterium]